MTFRLPNTGHEPPTFNTQPTSNTRPKEDQTMTAYTLTPQGIEYRIEQVANRLSDETIDTVNNGDASEDAQTAIKEAIVSELLPTIEQVIETPDARRIAQTVHERAARLIAYRPLRLELVEAMRTMYQVPQSMGLVEELDRLATSPAVARVAELKAQHADYRAGIQTALESFAELANEYAEEQSACGAFERAMSTLWAIAPAGYDSMPRRTVSTTVRITELIDIELPRDDEGDPDYSALDADEIRENGYSHGEEIEESY